MHKILQRLSPYHLIAKLKETRWKYRLYGSVVRVQGDAQIAKTVHIRNSYVYVDKTSTLILHENAQLVGIALHLTKGAHAEIGAHSFLVRERNPTRPEFIIDGGNLIIADHCRLACKRLWVRFRGRLEMGAYTNINYGSEIRADECVKIGAYCRISYDVHIWDTNTHWIYPPEQRRQLTEEYFPSFGHEVKKTQTRMISIGDDCWLGEGAALLKGTRLGRGVNVGFRTTICGNEIPDLTTVVQNLSLKFVQH